MVTIVTMIVFFYQGYQCLYVFFFNVGQPIVMMIYMVNNNNQSG